MSALKARAPKQADIGHLKGIMFGRPGAGKTWTALSFPRPYYIDTEGGARLHHYTDKLAASGGAYLGPSDGATDFPVIIEQVKALATEKHDFLSLVIDSITQPSMSVVARENERLGDKDVYGASKKPAVNYMRRLVNAIDRLDMNVWLIAHEIGLWENVNGQRTETGKTPDVWDKALHFMDLVLHVRAHSAKRRDAIVTKSRLTGFPQGDLIMLQEDGIDCGYDQIATRYGRDFIEAKPNTITLATTEQVTQLQQLFSALQLTEEQVMKALSKRNVDSLDEMTSKDAASAIVELRKKIEGI